MLTSNLFRPLLALIQTLFLSIARGAVSFLLPIPFFPAVSSVLANLVGIDPKTLKPNSLKLPPVLQKFAPTNLIPALLNPEKAQAPPLQSVTIEPGQKNRAWRQLTAERKITDEGAHLPGLSMDQGKKTLERPNIQTVDFGGSPEKEATKVVDTVDALQPVSSSLLTLTGLFDSSDAKARLPPPAMNLTPTQRDGHRKDEAYAKLSAETQVLQQPEMNVEELFHDLGVLLGAKSCAEQVSLEHSVSEAGQPPHPILLATKASPLPPLLPVHRHRSSAVSSSNSTSTTSSVSLTTGVGEAVPDLDFRSDE